MHTHAPTHIVHDHVTWLSHDHLMLMVGKHRFGLECMWQSHRPDPADQDWEKSKAAAYRDKCSRGREGDLLALLCCLWNTCNKIWSPLTHILFVCHKHTHTWGAQWPHSSPLPTPHLLPLLPSDQAKLPSSSEKKGSRNRQKKPKKTECSMYRWK